MGRGGRADVTPEPNPHAVPIGHLTVGGLRALLARFPAEYAVRVAWQHDEREVIGAVVATVPEGRPGGRRVSREPVVHLEVAAVVRR